MGLGVKRCKMAIGTTRVDRGSALAERVGAAKDVGNAANQRVV